MAFNGSGTFQRLYNWVNDAAANIKIRADRMDNEMDGIATGLSTCITKNGQTTITANLPMATYRHTGVGAGVARTDYARLDQLQDGKINWADAGGNADAITATYSPSVTTLVDGQLFYVRARDANATATPTFSPNALTARTIVKEGGNALTAGDIAGAGAELILRYNLANTRYELLNPKPAPINTEFSDTTFRIQDNGDATKELAFQLSGLDTSTLVTATIPNRSGEIFYIGDVLDEDDMASDSAVYPPTQQSVKAYISASGTIIPIATGVINGTAGTLRAGSVGATIVKAGTGRYELTITVPSGVTLVSAVVSQMSITDYENATFMTKAVVVDADTVKIVCQLSTANTYFDQDYINFVAFGTYD